jgi:hypothetical protein
MIALSASTAERREALHGEIERLQSELDWARLLELLGFRRLLPTLGPRIVERSGGRAEERFAAGVASAVADARRQGAFLHLIAIRAMEALAAAGIRSTALKGAVLSEALYGDPGRRQSSDIDLLVAEEQLHEAVDVVRTLGYGAPEDPLGARGLPLLHFALTHERETLPPIELHWRVHWYESRFARERLLVPVGGPAEGWRPEPVDELAALLLFYARDGFIGLRHAADIAAWWDAYGAGLAPGALDELIECYPALGPVIGAAAQVADRTVGLPSARLLHRTRLPARSRVAVRLADPYPHSSEAQLYADMSLIDGLLAPPGGLREFVTRQLLPPRESAPDGGRRAGAGFAIAHCTRMLSRYALALTRLPLAPRSV